jgi:putative hydrolase of the HAD superfamily
LTIRTLFLDAGGVLVHPSWRRVAETLGRYGVRVAAESLVAAEPAAKLAIDEGMRAGAPSRDAKRAWEYMELVLEGAGVALDDSAHAALRELRAYHAEHNLWEDVPADVVPALERLSSRGLRLVVVSNANGTVQRMFDRLGLSAHFHTICDSCVEGVEKPDPRFFRIALERAGAEAESTMHVGDLYHVDVVGARNAGLRPMLLDPHGLYAGYDAERIRTLDELADRLS